MEYYVVIKMIIMQKHEKCLWSTGHWKQMQDSRFVPWTEFLACVEVQRDNA